MDLKTPQTGGGRAVPVLFGFALFLSAALMFCLQPMVGRMLLPLVGGTPAGWVVALAFFQVALLAGYFFAHLLSALSARVQALAYIALLALGVCVLPVVLPAPADASPSAILLLLCGAIGPPFVALSASASTLQRLFAGEGARDPYFLYAASNLGSFAGLFLYIFLIDGHVGLAAQAAVWRGGYIALIALAIICLAVAGHGADVAVARAPLGWRRRTEWALLAFFPSALILSVTSHITTDIAAVPLLWVLPLGLYLLTFVIAFGRQDGRYAWVALAQPVFALSALALAVLETQGGVLQFRLLSTYAAPVAVIAGLCAAHLLAFTLTALVCHTRLAAARPADDPARLTEFYLMIALGGAAGGLFVAFAAPALFSHPVEYPLLLAAACLVNPRLRGWLVRGIVIAAAVLALGADAYLSHARGVVYDRNFFGTLKIYDRPGVTGVIRQMQAGASTYGFEILAPDGRANAMQAYDPQGAVRDALAATSPSRIAVVGLGAGILNCLSTQARIVDFYEINPAVIDSARRDFGYLSACGMPRIMEGDARLELQKEQGAYDLIIMDAFLSGMVPTHLLTQEAIGIYLQRLSPRGVLLFHLVNRYFDLDRPLVAAAQQMGLQARVVRADYPFPGAALWVAMARDGAVLEALPAATWTVPVLNGDRGWTDDRTDSLSGMRFFR